MRRLGSVALAATGLLFGLPLGVALGRVVWRVAAQAVPLEYIAPPMLTGLLLLIPAAVLLVNLIAVLPAVRAARVRPADVLRTE